jgi:hypothetical protein
VRILRGVLYLSGAEPMPKLTREVVDKAAETTGTSLPTLQIVTGRPREITFEMFERLYGEIDTLTAYVDELTDG